MPLTKRFLPLLLWAGAVLPATSHALACVEDGTNSAITREALGTALAISADAPDGTIIWESGPRSVQILCKQDYEANFSLNLRKGCDTPYTVSARFATTPGGGGVINGLLVPGNNKSVGISLSRVDSQQPLPFNDWFTLPALMGQGQSHNEFRADLKWRTQPIPGVFDAAVVVDMYYK
ncbi:hypothetical protein [Pseudomonas brenneri]|uniref:hypothetical protein n=1 Tax=Pseudomonas brenneri TaxID=129817 RepID=UPI0028D261FF|nr:hypothetical protein [Pseudomonas brenneri]